MITTHNSNNNNSTYHIVILSVILIIIILIILRAKTKKHFKTTPSYKCDYNGAVCLTWAVVLDMPCASDFSQGLPPNPAMGLP